MASEDICPEKRQAFANISLSRNTVAERIGELSENINSQLKDKVKSFTAFSVPIDESTDVSDVVQLAVFIRGVDENMQVTEEFVKLEPMKGTTTSDDIFVGLVGALDKLGVDWAQTVSLATDGAPQMRRTSSCKQDLLRETDYQLKLLVNFVEENEPHLVMLMNRSCKRQAEQEWALRAMFAVRLTAYSE
ncbi:general transcription factor II-I repeat domain-containing protein 2-like [Homarus americanus]|uniref:general transcription factor II-I repeat domain-containing protein 2-like n=1 Tax=Homarus americanus TaxID=6706 RepID=UPI001C490F0F|nr:general transcription factor II-I repeat domain-containing protein 2-like [Homarus americanus]